MRTVVCFRAGAGEYAVPVEQVREVRADQALMPLPRARPGVVGLLPIGEDAFVVVDALGAAGTQVLLLEGGTSFFGLRVEEVTGVKTVTDVGPAPAGQDDELIDGVFTDEDHLTLLVSVDKLGERIEP